MNSNYANAVLRKNLVNAQSSTSVASKVLAGQAAKLPTTQGTQCAPTAGTCAQKTILPESARAIFARMPQGRQDAPLSIGCNLEMESTVTVHVDMTGQGLTLTKVPVVLFDHNDFHSAKNAIAAKYPAGTVYIGSAAANLYPSWLNRICGRSFVFDAVKIDVSVAAGAAASAELQLQEMINVFNHNTRNVQSSQIEVGNYTDDRSTISTTRVIPLTDQKAVVDGSTAWAFNVYEGVKVTFTFFNAAELNL